MTQQLPPVDRKTFWPLFFSDAQAFCAHVKDGKVYSQGEKIKFDDLSFISGGGYSPLQSQYTCPETGFYFFTFSIYSDVIKKSSPNNSGAELIIDSTRRIDALSYNANRKYIAVHASQSIIQRCVKGNVVFMRSRYNNNRVGGFERRTSFCGFCISC